MTAGFLLRCQNLLRYFTPSMKKSDLTNINVIGFDPIKIWTNKAPQSNPLNLIFLKDVFLVAKKTDHKWWKKCHL